MKKTRYDLLYQYQKTLSLFYKHRMSYQNLIIYQFTPFYKIFKEIEKELNFNIIEASNDKALENTINVFENYIIISKKKYSNISSQLIIDKLPINILKVVEKINIEFLKTQLEKALNDVEELKDKVRQNGGH